MDDASKLEKREERLDPSHAQHSARRPIAEEKAGVRRERKTGRRPFALLETAFARFKQATAVPREAGLHKHGRTCADLETVKACVDAFCPAVGNGQCTCAETWTVQAQVQRHF